MKTFTGTVTSTKMEKTIVVTVDYLRPHPLYRKLLRSSRKIKADVGSHTIVKGDLVKIGETRPKSKSKSFVVVEVLKTHDTTTK